MTSWLLRVMDTVTNMFEFSMPIDSEVDFLGVMYAAPDPKTDKEGFSFVNSSFMDDFVSRIWLTYRRDFESLMDKDGNPTLITSDAGWGCSVRVTQMLLAQCISYLRLGRDWRISSGSHADLYSLLPLFRDSLQAPLSIHQMVSVGHSRFGKRPSEWFGPTTGARAITYLVNNSQEELPFTCMAFDSGDIYSSEIQERLSATGKPLVLLLTYRLGLDSLDLSRYKKTIRTLFTNQFFQGLSSGESMVSAYYFFAVSEDYLYYLDPHTVQKAYVEIGSEKQSVPPQPKPLKMRWSRLNPSMTMGFVVRSASEWEALRAWLRQTDPELFDVQEKRREFANFSTESQDEDDLVVIH